MNGPRIGYTYGSGTVTVAGASVRAFGGGLRCQFAGETADVAGGAGSAVELRFDQDRPVGGWGWVVDFYVGGSLVATLPSSPPSSNLYSSAPWLAGCHDAMQFSVSAGGSVSDVTVTRWDNDFAAAAWDGTGTSAAFAVRPPVGGNVVRLPSGQQFLSRMTTNGANSAAEVTVFERPGPGADWAANEAAGSIGALLSLSPFGDGDTMAYRNPVMFTRQHYLVAYGHGQHPDADEMKVPFEVWGSLTFGLDWLAAVAYDDSGDPDAGSVWDRLRTPIDDVWWQPTAAQEASCPFTMMRAYPDGVHFGVWWPTGLGDERLLCLNAPDPPGGVGGFADEIADLSGRSGRNTPWPFFHRLPDGRFHVGCFVDGNYRAWESTDTTGTSWAEAEDQAVSDPFTLFASCAFWKGASGREAVVGHVTDPDNVEDEGFRLFTRAGTGQQWEGPYLNVLGTTAAHPYLYERTDGTWEVGWRIGDTWHRYEADTPASELVDWSSL